ncbi:MAG: dephospho-CoA kinase [Sediminibacterium sp.]|nr:dephospho-CoA kinase [Sediminibacterium sp.]
MIVGLTGGIGSGKSTVALVFEKLGAAVYYSDERAKAAYFFEDVKPQIIKLLGNATYLSESSINKPYISEKIFSDEHLRQKLNAILHPAVENDFRQFAAKLSPNTLLIKESALLFEVGLEQNVNTIILVTAPIELRIKRVMKRDGLTEELVRKKIDAQWPEEEKRKRAHYIIENNEELLLVPQIISVFNALKAGR